MRAQKRWDQGIQNQEVTLKARGQLLPHVYHGSRHFKTYYDSVLYNLGGQCKRGKIVEKGFLFTFMEDGRSFCRKHMKCVDNDSRKNTGFQ